MVLCTGQELSESYLSVFHHPGHFLLTNLLLDKLKASAPSRIINLSSLAHVAGHIDFEDLNWEKRKYDTKAAYCQSKLAVVLFTKELSRRLQGVCVASLAGLPFPLAPSPKQSCCDSGWTGGQALTPGPSRQTYDTLTTTLPAGA